MSELDQKIKQISDMLSNKEAQESIQKLIRSFSGSSPANAEKNSPKNDDINTSLSEIENTPDSYNPSSYNNDNDTEDIIQKINTVLSSMNVQQDNRVNLLRSIQPFLNTRRKEHCKTCINILRTVEIIKLISKMK